MGSSVSSLNRPLEPKPTRPPALVSGGLFEIETGKSDAPANVRKCLAAGVDEVVVAATTPTVRDDLARTVASPPKVELLTAGEAVRQGCW